MEHQRLNPLSTPSQPPPNPTECRCCYVPALILATARLRTEHQRLNPRATWCERERRYYHAAVGQRLVTEGRDCLVDGDRRARLVDRSRAPAAARAAVNPPYGAVNPPYGA
eukprot:2799539-Pyramimonas_sp.AAC.1